MGCRKMYKFKDESHRFVIEIPIHIFKISKELSRVWPDIRPDNIKVV